MYRLAAAIALVLLLPAITWGQQPDDQANQFWGQWRGPSANGVATHGTPPTQWSESKNVRWKVPMAGHGLSTPIVWGDVVYVQSAIPVNEADTPDEKTKPQTHGGERRGDGATDRGVGRAGRHGDRAPKEADRGPGRRGGRGRGMRSPAPTVPYKFVITALDRRTGQQVWQHTVREEIPHEGSHRDGSLAPASPLTDGTHLFAYFGSRGLYCFDMNGALLWEKDFGDMQTRNGFGEGSSPVLFGDTIVVNWDQEGGSFIVALDKSTGKQRWKKKRDEATTWSTPLVVTDSGLPQLITTATNRVRSYNLATGQTVWECGGLGVNCIPSPVAFAGTVYVMSGYRDPALLAISYAGAKGDLTATDAVVWKTEKDTPYVPSPLLYGNALYFLKKNTEILSCLDPESGKPHYKPQRLKGIKGVYASPVGADNRVYVVGRNGVTHVLERSQEFKTLAVNELEDEFSASPAIAGSEIYLRGRDNLYCIAPD